MKIDPAVASQSLTKPSLPAVIKAVEVDFDEKKGASDCRQVMPLCAPITVLSTIIEDP